MSGEAMRAEMAEQPAVLARLVDRFEVDTRRLRNLMPTRPLAVWFLGRGSSNNAGTYGRYVAEMVGGVPAGHVAPSIVTRYLAAADYHGHVVVALSQSGATPEIVTTASRLRDAGARVVAVTNDGLSPLAAVADLVLTLEAGPERAVPATKTVTAQALLCGLVGAVAGGARLPVGANRLAPAVSEVLTDGLSPRRLAARWATIDRLVVTGRGPMVAAAFETALKIKETAMVLAEGMSQADLLHGPIAAVESTLPVLCLDGDPATGQDMRELGDRLRASDTSTADVGPAPTCALPYPADVPPLLRPILAIVRGQQLAAALAAAKNCDPDLPAGLSKITVTT